MSDVEYKKWGGEMSGYRTGITDFAVFELPGLLQTSNIPHQTSDIKHRLRCNYYDELLQPYVLYTALNQFLLVFQIEPGQGFHYPVPVNQSAE